MIFIPAEFLGVIAGTQLSIKSQFIGLGYPDVRVLRVLKQ